MSNAELMWQVLIDHFRRFPAQEKVVRKMIEHGLRIHDGKIHAKDVEVADTALARAAGVDRRIVRATVQAIGRNQELSDVFSRLLPTLHLKDVGPGLGCGVIEIIPRDAHQPGILAGVSKVIAESGISIRQANVEDPEFMEEPRLYVVTEEPIPGSMIPKLQEVEGVRGVAVY